MTRTALTADLGNSALKLLEWQLLEGPLSEWEGAAETWSPGRAFRLSWEDGWEVALDEALSGLHTLELAVSCSVTRAARAELLGALLARHVEEYYPDPESGLEIACRQSETIGRDRLYAARGAWQLVRGPALVVDAGTALTVDALAVAKGRPCFLGGAIAPGPELLAAALSRGAVNLFEIEPDPTAPALGRSSAEALRAGVSIGFIGAAAELVRRVSREADLAAAPILLTGGARGFLEAPGVFGGRRPRVEPQLVHRGLLAAALGVAGTTR